MTDPVRAARQVLTLISSQLHVTRYEGAPDTSRLRAARAQVEELLRETSSHSPIETITSVERLTVGLLLQLAKNTHAPPEVFLQTIGVLYADQGGTPDPAIALLTVRLDMIISGSPSDTAQLDALRQDLLADAATGNSQRTLRTLTKIATAVLIELANALGVPAENLLARLTSYTSRPDH